MDVIIFVKSITAVESYKCPGGRLTPKQRAGIVIQNNKYRSRLIHGLLKNKDNITMPRGKNMLKLVKTNLKKKNEFFKK